MNDHKLKIKDSAPKFPGLWSRGMTLAELLIAMSLFLIVMYAVVLFESNIFSYQRTASGSYITVQDSETILKIMTKEIRMMSPGADGSYALQNAATSTMTFFADVNGDGIKERVRYTFASTTLYRSITPPSGSPSVYLNANQSTTTIMVNVRNGTSTPVFEYFDGSYDGNEAALAQPVTTTAVRLVRVNITLDVDPLQPPLPRTYSTQVTLRNIKNNL